MPEPRLVLVSGMPASGKTTLAHEIGRLVPCAVICRDEVKEGLVMQAVAPHRGGALASPIKALSRFSAASSRSACVWAARSSQRQPFSMIWRCATFVSSWSSPMLDSSIATSIEPHLMPGLRAELPSTEFGVGLS